MCFLKLTGGQDYVVLSDLTVTFDAGSDNGATECFDVLLIDDDVLEKTERFSLNITSVEDNVNLTISNLVIHVSDDESK